MSLARVFLLRAAGVVLIASAIGVFLIRESWGAGAIPTLSWASVSAWCLGVIGYRSLAQAMSCEPSRLMFVMTLGLLQRLLALAASQAVVFLAYGHEWGKRSLIATTLLYLLVLGVEVFTLNQSLKAGAWREKDSASQASAEEESRTGDTAE